MASAPLPEKGLIKTNLVSSFGMPNKLKKGETIEEIAFEIPLISKSSVKTKMLTKYGKMLTAKGIADFAPVVNAS